MKVVILAGGFGTRLGELTNTIPKPMLRVGNIPIIHHIMNCYSNYGYNDFLIALGYKSWEIKNYFLNYDYLSNDFTIDFSKQKINKHKSNKLKWKVTLVDTGIETMTGGRLKRLKNYVDSKPFFMTYGDGLSNVNINKLLKFHKKHKKIATVTAVRPIPRFGELDIDDNTVKSFKEKPQSNTGWINGGYFVFDPEIFNLIEGDQTILEAYPLEELSMKGELFAYKHSGFWQCIDTKRDLDYVNNLSHNNNEIWLSNHD